MNVCFVPFLCFSKRSDDFDCWQIWIIVVDMCNKKHLAEKLSFYHSTVLSLFYWNAACGIAESYSIFKMEYNGAFLKVYGLMTFLRRADIETDINEHKKLQINYFWKSSFKNVADIMKCCNIHVLK